MFKILFSVIFLFSFNVFSQSTGKVIQADNIQGVDVEKNYIPNGLAENFNVIGWNRYDDGAVARPVDGTGGTADYISIAHTTTSPLEDKGSFLITKTANNARGEGLSIDFKVPRAKRGERQCIFIDYEITSGTFTAGTDTTDSDLIAYIYDKDRNKEIEPEIFKFFSIGQDKFGGCWSPFDSTSDDYRLILHVANTNANAWTMKIDNVKVGVRNTPRGPPVVDLGSYTPIFTNLGTVTSHNFEQYRIGKKLKVKFRFTAASGGASVATVSLPTGLTISTAGNQVVGAGWSQSTTSKDFFVTAVNGESVVRFIANNGAGGPFNGSDFGSGIVDGWFEVDIQGWSSNTRISDGFEGRDVALITQASGQSITNSASDIQITSFTNPSLDTVSGFSSNSYTVKTSGLYDIFFSASFTTTATAGTIIVRMKINGTTIVNFGAGSGMAAFSAIGGPIKIPLKANDNLTFHINNASGGALTIDLARLFIEKSASPATIAASPVVAMSAQGAAAATITNTASVIIFNSKESDTHNAYNTTTGVFTAPESGFYSADWSVTAPSVNLSTSERFFSQLNKNGSTYRVGQRSNGIGAANAHYSQGSANSIYLKAGETLSVSATSSVSTAVGTSTTEAYFTVTKVGN